MAMAKRAAARECGKQSLAEACVHEAVNNWVNAGRGVAQQVDESDGCPRERLFGRDIIESPPGVDTVQRHPAEKEQDYDDHQHPDHSLLGLQLGFRCVASWLFPPERPAGPSNGGHFHGVWPLGDIAAVSVIAVSGHRGGQTVLHLCVEEQETDVNRNNEWTSLPLSLCLSAFLALSLPRCPRLLINANTAMK